MGYTKDTIRGFTWMSGFRIITRLFSFVRIAILARLLTPEQFGVFGIATLSLVFFETFSQTGISVFLIQEKKKLEEYVDSAFLISLTRGVVLSLLLFLFSPLIANYFDSQEALPLLKLISLVALIRGFINPSRVRYIKDLEFRGEFVFSFMVFLVDSVFSVIIAVLLRSPIGLVWGLLIGSAFEMFMSHFLVKPRPKLNFDLTKTREMIKRGRWVAGSSAFSYLYEQGDDMFVGKLLDTYSLGIYQAAYKISSLPITEITRVFNQVTFPIYSQISDEAERLKLAFSKMLITSLILTTPIGVIIYVFSNEITLLLLGSNWVSVVPILKVLAMFGVLRAVSVTTQPLFNAIKRQDIAAKISFISLLVMVVSIIPLIRVYGTMGAAYSVLFATIVSLPISYFYLRKEIYK